MAMLRGAFSLLLILLNTVVWIVPLLGAHLAKVLVPWAPWRRFWSRAQNGAGTAWIAVNNGNLALANPVRWDVQGVEELAPGRWYLVVANHRSWVDILVLQRVLNGRIPFLKFLLKKELIWVPLLGLAWWLLDFPFLERSSNPGKDLKTIRRAAAKFRLTPVSIMNFVEGTRFTPEKREAQSSPYRHLLKPKAGGIALVLEAMGEGLHRIVDVTIAYPGGAPTLWEFLCGRAREVRVRVRSLPLDPELVGDFARDKGYRRRLVSWLGRLWQEKDLELDSLLVP